MSRKISLELVVSIFSSGLTIGTEFLRFLPSFVVVAIILFVLVLADLAQVRSMINLRRETAAVMLRDSQFLLNGHVNDTLRNARDLAARIDPSFDIDQETFEALVKETMAGSAKLTRAELAPGFVIQMVYPQVGNQTFIGTYSAPTSSGESGDLEGETARGAGGATRFHVTKSGLVELQVQREVRKTVGPTVVSTGMVKLVMQFEPAITIPSEGGRFGEVDFLLLAQSYGAPPPIVPSEWQVEGNFKPYITIAQYPQGNLLLFLRPADGWQPQMADMVGYRLRLAVLGLLLLLPVVLANWFVVSQNGEHTRLSQMQDQLKSVLKDLPGAAMTVTWPPGATGESKDDTVFFLNKEACYQVWGVHAQEAEADLGLLRSRNEETEETATLQREIQKSVDAMRPWTSIWPIRTPDGERRWLEGHGHPTRMPDGSTRWTSIVFNVTEQVQRKQELEQQRQHGEKLQRLESIDKLTGGVAHDFNNLLAVIMSSLELLCDDEEDPEKILMLKASINAAQRGATLTRSMLAFGRNAPLDPSTIDLNRLVNEMRNWAGRTLPANIEVKTALPEGLWPIEADQTSSEAALLNLIVNARDAMPEGGKLTIETENIEIGPSNQRACDDDLQSGRYVMLAVSDSGLGIAKELQAKIFEPFYSTKSLASGSGLGLSMVQGFMRQTGGAVRVISEPNSGTTFKLFFPTKVKEADSALEVKSPSKPVEDTSKFHILLAEDQDEVRAIIEKALTKAGHHVTAAASGDEAFKLFKADPRCDLLLTDIIMPGDLQGPKLSQVLRKIRPDLPVVFMSGYASETATDGNGLRPQDIRLTKPVMRTDLLEAIRKTMQS